MANRVTDRSAPNGRDPWREGYHGGAVPPGVDPKPPKGAAATIPAEDADEPKSGGAEKQDG